jgi:hypothetical protein
MKFKLAEYFFVFSLFLVFANCMGQNSHPVTKQEVIDIKKNPELGYLHEAFKGEKGVDTDTTSQKKKQKLKQKKEAVRRVNNFDKLNIPESFLIGLKWFFYLSILFGVILLIIKGDFRSFKFRNNTEFETEITDNTIVQSAEHLNRISFEQQITAAETSGNFRLAVRLYFLWTLKLLSNKKLISYNLKKTNNEYALELKNTIYHIDFEGVANFYNYIWYGEFMVSEAKYQQVKSSFNQFIAKL